MQSFRNVLIGAAGHLPGARRQRLACGATRAPRETGAPAATSAPLTAGKHWLPEVDWPWFVGSLWISGAITGTLLDGIHSRTALQVYDVLPLHLGPLETSALVPPLLGTFYVTLGTLGVCADALVGSDATTARAVQRTQRYAFVLLCYALLAASLQVSAYLYQGGVAYSTISAVLASVTALTWWRLDGTRQGLALVALCAVAAPAAEVVLMAWAHTWHYSQPDVAGVFVSWVPWCYAFYVPSVLNLARFLMVQQQHQRG